MRIYVTNRLPRHLRSLARHQSPQRHGRRRRAHAALHKAGETFKYELTLRQYGTHMYHSHHDEMTQMGMGMIGMFIIHPQKSEAGISCRPRLLAHDQRMGHPGRDVPSEYAEMTDFNVLTINGKVFPSTAPLICKTGDRVRIRLGNLGATDHHPMHIHGHHFRVTGDRRRGDSAVGTVARIDGARRRRANAQYRIHLRCARRLGVSLSYDAPRR